MSQQGKYHFFLHESHTSYGIFFNVLDVSYYVNNNESDYISVLAKINGDKVLGALKRVSQG